jgi:CheY-like chemotaxis protein
MAPPHILLVDDDEDTCASMADVLADLGYPVEVATDARTALDLARGRRYSLALLDYKMPEMSGVELFLRIRQFSPDTSGIMVTAFPEDDVRRAAESAGIQRVLPKPIAFDELLPLIEGTVGNHR